MKHNCLSIRIVEEIRDFFWAVAIVGIRRNKPSLKRGDIGFKVFGAVIQVSGHLALMCEASRQHVCSQRVGALIELSPRDDSFALNLTRVIWDARSDSLIQISKVPVRHVSPSRSQRRAYNRISALDVKLRCRTHLGSDRTLSPKILRITFDVPPMIV